jgi:DNA-binding transcriptional ArsR family regulator
MTPDRLERDTRIDAPAERMSTAVFAALSDPTRRRVLDLLAAAGEATATTVAAQLPVSRPAVVKHLGVLDRAGLVTARRSGREVRYAVQPQAAHAAARELDAIAAEWDARLRRIRPLAESPDGP